MSKPNKPENAFLNLIFNVVLPVFILHKATQYTGPLIALIVAISFPIAYGIYDIYKRHKVNFISILGLLNVGVTGGLAILNPDGSFFPIKEAFFPLIIGIFVFFSSFTDKPFLKTLFLNPQVIHIDKLQERLQAKNTVNLFNTYVKRSTLLLSFSFFLSASLNYILALRVFKLIPSELDAESKAALLNEQIAEMTSKSIFVILVPSMIFLAIVVFYILKGIKKATDLSAEELFKN